MRLLQISDTHFGTERPEVVQALLRAARELEPTLVVLCGDITQRARAGEFAAARRFMDALPAAAQRIALPGNHDVPLFNLWARLLHPYAAYRACFGERETLWRGAGLSLLALDATHPGRHKDGALEPRHLEQRLQDARAGIPPEDLLIVAAHQPLWTAWEMDGGQTLIGRQRTAQLLAAARVDAVLSGHVHVPLLATSEVLAPRLGWQFLLSGSGTAVSQRTRVGVPNSFNLLVAAPQQPGLLRAERYDYLDGVFRLAAAVPCRRSSRGWEAAGPARVDPV